MDTITFTIPNYGEKADIPELMKSWETTINQNFTQKPKVQQITLDKDNWSLMGDTYQQEMEVTNIGSNDVLQVGLGYMENKSDRMNAQEYGIYCFKQEENKLYFLAEYSQPSIDIPIIIVNWGEPHDNS